MTRTEVTQCDYQEMGCIRNLSSSQLRQSCRESNNKGSSDQITFVLSNGLSLVQRVYRRRLHDAPIERCTLVGPLMWLLLLIKAVDLDPSLWTYVLDDQRRESLCPKTSSVSSSQPLHDLVFSRARMGRGHLTHRAPRASYTGVAHRHPRAPRQRPYDGSGDAQISSGMAIISQLSAAYSRAPCRRCPATRRCRNPHRRSVFF
jgi:hypothetical protein